MTRNLKIVGMAALACLALSAVVASAAQAAVEFHKPAGEEIRLTVTPDGAGATAHQVFDAAGASITCPDVSGETLLAAAENTSPTITAEKIQYPAAGSAACKFVGQSATVNMKECDYKFTAAAPGTPGANAAVEVKCKNAGEEIEFKVPNPVCTVTVPPQVLAGVTYHNNAAKSEVTVEAHVAGISYTAAGAGCPEVGAKVNGNYTTGNFIVTGESTAGLMRPVFVE